MLTVEEAEAEGLEAYLNMARKLPPPGFVTQAQLARELGVSRSAICQAVKAGRLTVYDINGRPIRADGTRPRRKPCASVSTERGDAD
jgi:hypothetical protein